MQAASARRKQLLPVTINRDCVHRAKAGSHGDDAVLAAGLAAKYLDPDPDRHLFAMDPSTLILDVQEKEVAAPKVPSFPQMKTSQSGFPEHKKRTRISAFKQKRQGPAPPESATKVFTTSTHEPLQVSNDDATTTTETDSFETREQRRIDRENNEKLASMSPAEIEAARQELFGGLDPKTLEMLLRRANIDDPNGPSPFDAPGAKESASAVEAPPQIKVEDTSKPSDPKKVRFQSTVEEDDAERQAQPHKHAPEQPKRDPVSESHDNVDHDNDDTDDVPVPSAPPADQIITPSNDPQDQEQPEPKPHWPQPPQPADLDPNDPDFLESLHKKYFPSLPADPSKLAWMAPIPTPNSPADYDSPYHPDQSSYPIASLRFDFRGTLLPPRISRAVPVSKGLHHHGEAPEAAGYTVAELARLTRSAVPGQRCIAYQTLGRILFRLGRGEFGGGPSEDVPMGIWRQMEEGAVMRSIYEEAGTEEGRGHRSARAFAIEAVWLFDKGGWKEKLKKGK
ncbi:RPAP1-like protein [Microdochium trichocladiopsis]|uniref:RPAP1-like protein n=1 Tax=Microdochium trichocladiopsis TaxID=1682393 RepID=A0A9P9BP98_9PEZI|nr:RPAP1-like protein [Microdochium trichocladiopsis]KAH7029049.1 RPAP1-like protein [Microdochium trichocladiopsis]